jgi:DNA-binding GntR family transcriptional regulator
MFKCIKSRNYEAAKDAAYNHIQAAAKVALAVIAAEQK